MSSPATTNGPRTFTQYQSQTFQSPIEPLANGIASASTPSIITETVFDEQQNAGNFGLSVGLIDARVSHGQITLSGGIL